ncbi:hypothetical protein HDU81_000666 [Chytriomyces hyalinus]|nr:hypothetical protein HDU81_000666 [Chytriomyces hyalinus]
MHENVLDLEKTMIDLWDSFKAALERNKPAGIKPTANVTIGNPDRKRKHNANKGGKGKSNAYSEYDCNACWRCGSSGHLSKNCPKKPNNGSNSGGDDRSSVHSSSSNNTTVAATTTINAKPKHTGWVPTSGLLNSN